MPLKIIKIIFTDFNMTMKHLQAPSKTIGFRGRQF